MAKLKNPNDEKLITNVGNNVRKYRTSQNLSIVKLAELCNVEYTTISKIERGKINTTVTMISRICKALNISISQLFE
ncbi:helix-turn-helix domain-containing protein [Pedobacter steynii]